MRFTFCLRAFRRLPWFFKGRSRYCRGVVLENANLARFSWRYWGVLRMSVWIILLRFCILRQDWPGENIVWVRIWRFIFQGYCPEVKGMQSFNVPLHHAGMFHCIPSTVRLCRVIARAVQGLDAFGYNHYQRCANQNPHSNGRY